MKIKLLSSLLLAGTALTFHKGRTYTATPATNLPRWARLKDGKLTINKVFISRKGEDASMLAERADFEIVDCPEKDELTAAYAKAKEPKPPREKKLVPNGLQLREGYAPITDEQAHDEKVYTCGMGTAQGRCNKPSKFTRTFTAGITQGRCLKHATFVSATATPVK